MEATATSAAPRPTIVSFNPATGEPLGEVPVLAASEVRAAVERGRAAQQSWGQVPPQERGRRILALRKAIVARAEEIAQALALESGKTKTEALAAEVFLVADLTTYFAKRAHRILAPRPIHLHPRARGQGPGRGL
jgi:acyl-CoA reductase-like NAD-dependent aldehyde dehydrogenase